ncbi:hypothetical protein GIV96_13445 [Pseudomonas syringae]|nr:hypothetical protein [Pseudomonas syringae]MCF5315043.1 hypothetical protein [Pseudomonas syringae]MCF5362007.1 hypothetical protein [Pseudomonas syringae]MCF5392198.1 hypothetical protein [Pseudomonas syringae]MCF5396283.1 hypothetical protein [Pseudomonas syringae]
MRGARPWKTEHWFTLLAQRDWEAIGKHLYQKKKATVQHHIATPQHTPAHLRRRVQSRDHP